MALWSDAPPEPRTRLSNKPTLLFSWWCTLFSAAIILMRISGRKIRSNSFYVEDKVMFLSLAPLFIRMALVHIVITHGTNNVVTDGLLDWQIANRETGSRLVLASRIFYAMFIWMSKLTVSEFLKRTFYNTWRRSYERVLHFIRLFLGFTFMAVVIATLAECQPFDNYWQVVPDPGPQCRQGFAQLITMGVADIITDILIVLFPIPIILRSHVSVMRKISLILLFSASLLMIGVTGTRVPKVIEMQGRQQYRTVWASIEVLLSTFVANAVILGSFVRGTGAKKNKYRAQSFSDSIERAPTRRTLPPTTLPNESDEDLFRSIGCRIPTELIEGQEEPPSTPSFMRSPRSDLEAGDDKDDFSPEKRASRWDRQHKSTGSSSRLRAERESTSDLAAFFRNTSPSRIPTTLPRPPQQARTTMADLSIADVGGLLGAPTSGSRVHPSYEQPPATSSTMRSTRQLLPRRSSGTLPSTYSRTSNDHNKSWSHRAPSRPRSRPTSVFDPEFVRSSNADLGIGNGRTSDAMELSDVGGLLK